jgi:hypothetical protein
VPEVFVWRVSFLKIELYNITLVPVLTRLSGRPEEAH